MNAMLSSVIGWLGLLLRPAVSVQVVAIAALLLIYRAWRRRRRPDRDHWPWLLGELAVIAGLLAVAAGLGVVGLPHGLLLFAAQLLSLWLVLDGLRLLLIRARDPAGIDDFFRRAIHPLVLLLATLALIDRLQGLQELSRIPLITLFGEPITLGSALLLLTVPYFLVVLSEIPVLLIGALLQRAMGMEGSNRKAFELISRYLLIGVGVLWIANQVGLNGNAIAAVAGGLSVGLGFGIKEVFSNFVSGLWLLFEGSVRPGEILFFDGDHCEVRRLGLRAATLWRDRDNAELVIPNQTFFTSTTTTYTGSDRMRRCQVEVGTAYRHDPDGVIPLLEATALAHPNVLSQPPPKALLMGYGDSSINYALRFWIDHPLQSPAISSDVRRAIWRAFAAHAIEIPFPQRVLHQADP